jgi:hypothetical protein
MERRWCFALGAVVVSALAGIEAAAFARPPETGDWDPRFQPQASVADPPGSSVRAFDWWTASFAERKAYLQDRYGVPPKQAAIAATSGMPLGSIDPQGRGAFITPRALGMNLVVRF